MAERGATYAIRSICALHTGSLKEESNRARGLALTLAERAHELLELGGSLDLEEDLVVVIRHFDIQVLGVTGSLLALGGGAAVAVLVLGRHDGWLRKSDGETARARCCGQQKKKCAMGVSS